MRAVVCSLGVSLDGFAIDAAGTIDFSTPDEAVFRAATDEVRDVGVHLLGRRLYEAMTYWDGGAEDPELSELEREFARVWAAMPKVVLSSTLTEVAPGYELSRRSLAEEVAHWRAQPGTGDVALGGPTLGAAAADLGLVDEYRLRVFPVVVGGGTPYFPRNERRQDLELLESRTFASGLVALRYRVVRA